MRFLKTEEQKNKIYYFLNLCAYVKKNLEVKRFLKTEEQKNKIY